MSARIADAICPWCAGRGEYRGVDAAGDVDDLWCSRCRGSGRVSQASLDAEAARDRERKQRAEAHRRRLDRAKGHLATLTSELLGLVEEAAAELRRERRR